MADNLALSRVQGHLQLQPLCGWTEGAGISWMWAALRTWSPGQAGGTAPPSPLQTWGSPSALASPHLSQLAS